VEGGIPAARKKRVWSDDSRKIQCASVCARFFRRAGKPGSTAGKDACRHGCGSKKMIAKLRRQVQIWWSQMDAIHETLNAPQA